MLDIKGIKNSARAAIMALVLGLAIGLSACRGQETPIEPTQAETIQDTASPTVETSTPEPTSTPVPTNTPVPTPTFDITMVEDWGSGRLLFTLEEHGFGEKNDLGVYQLDLASGTLTQIASSEIRLLDTSPDHMSLLAARGSELILINLHYGSETLLADDYYHLSPSGAKWDHSSNLIYYLAVDGSEIQLIKLHPESGETDQLSANSPIAIIKAGQNTVILGRGSCNPFGNCVYTDLSWITDQGIEVSSSAIGDYILLPCQSLTDFVYAEKDENGSLTFHIRPQNQDPETVFYATWPEFADCAWSPNGNRIAAIQIDRFWYSGSIQEYYFQLLIPSSNQFEDRSYLNAPLDHVVWSPDGVYTAFSGTKLNEDIYQLEISLFNLDSISVSRFSQFDQFKSENYITIPGLFWAP